MKYTNISPERTKVVLKVNYGLKSHLQRPRQTRHFHFRPWGIGICIGVGKNALLIPIEYNCTTFIWKYYDLSFIFSTKKRQNVFMICDHPEEPPHQERREVFLPWGGLVEASLLRWPSLLLPIQFNSKILQPKMTFPPLIIWAKATFFFEQIFPVVARTWWIPKSVCLFLGPKFRFLAKKSDFCHTTPILVNDPFVALEETVHWESTFYWHKI